MSVFLEDGVGLVNGGCAVQSEFFDQPVLEGAGHALDPALGLGGASENLLYSQFTHGPGELGGAYGLRHAAWPAIELEHTMPVAVDSQRKAPAPDGAFRHEKAAPDILAGTEKGIDRCTRGIVSCQQQGEPRSPVLQPG